MSDGSTEKMSRALYDKLGHDLAERRADSYAGAPRIIAGMEIAARRWDKIETLRWAARRSPLLATRNSHSSALYDRMEDLLFEDASQRLQGMGPIEYGASLQGALRQEDRAPVGGVPTPYWSTRADDLIRSFQRLGPERSGLLLEVIAPPGSGKSNLLTYIGRVAMANGHDVFCNFLIKTGKLRPTPEADKLGKFHLARSARELLPQLIRFARDNPRRVGFFLCDEAGGRGMSSGTATTVEARDALLFFQQSRKFRINSFRARQIHNVPKAQQELEVGRIEFRTGGPNGGPGRLGQHMPMRVEWTHGAPVGAPEDEITVPNMKGFYDTYQQAAFEWNVRMGDMWSYVNRRAEGAEAQLVAIEEFLALLPPPATSAAPSAAANGTARPIAVCPKCSHRWTPRVDFPQRCPEDECQKPWPLGKPGTTTTGTPVVSVSTRAMEKENQGVLGPGAGEPAETGSEPVADEDSPQVP